MSEAEKKVIEIMKGREGLVRTRELLKHKIHPRVIYKLRDEGVIVSVSRGVYQLAEMSPSNPDLSVVATRIPNGVLCLISALSYFELTTEIPHEVYISLKRGSEKPRVDYPPVRLFWMSGDAFFEGIEVHEIDGAKVKVYCVEKTLADCFKYRNKIGMDVVLEALKFCRESYRLDANKLMHYARICRVEKIMKPYLEATL
jgi:predicted transcriptional regulator of viral defense system